MSMREVIYRFADGTSTKDYEKAAAVGGYTIELHPIERRGEYNAERVKALKEKLRQNK